LTSKNAEQSLSEAGSPPTGFVPVGGAVGTETGGHGVVTSGDGAGGLEITWL